VGDEKGMVAGLITVAERFYKRQENSVDCLNGQDVFGRASGTHGDVVAGVALGGSDHIEFMAMGALEH
jgi:hypothetical protein